MKTVARNAKTTVCLSALPVKFSLTSTVFYCSDHTSVQHKTKRLETYSTHWPFTCRWKTLAWWSWRRPSSPDAGLLMRSWQIETVEVKIPSTLLGNVRNLALSSYKIQIFGCSPHILRDWGQADLTCVWSSLHIFISNIKEQKPPLTYPNPKSYSTLTLNPLLTIHIYMATICLRSLPVSPSSIDAGTW